MLLYLATAHGLWRFAVHLRFVLQALRHLAKVPFWAPPLFLWHLALAFVRVAWRRLRGAPRSKRWNFLVEFFVDSVRPRQSFTRNWHSCIEPALQTITHLDYVGQVVACLCHPKVHMEFVTQGCPRPVTWVWFKDKCGVRAPEQQGLVVLYLHGGGYIWFTGRSHLEYVARIVKNLETPKLPVKACLLDYRRVAWPAPLEDAVACYDWLRQGCGVPAERIVLAGDSAGGGLCLCLLLALRDAGKALPMCATVISPFTDLARTEEQYPEDDLLDKDFLPVSAPLACLVRYVQCGANPRNPLISPKYGQLHALPPVLIQAGESELLAKDSVDYAKRLEAYGGTVQLEMYPDMPHVFPMLAPLGLEDAQVAIARQAHFITGLLPGNERGAGGSGRKRRVQVLVRDKRTQSFEDLRGEARSAHRMSSCTSSPVLALDGDLRARAGG